MSSVCYCLMPRPMGLQPCPQDSDWCSWRKAGRPAQGGKVGPGQALCGGWRSMADTRGRFSRGRGEVAPESDPGPQGRAGLCLGSSWSPSEVSFQVCPPGVFLQVSPSRRVLQVSSSRHALQACSLGVPSRCLPPGMPSRRLPPGVPLGGHPETLPVGTPPPRTPQQKDNTPTSPRSSATEPLAEAGGGRDGACRVWPSRGWTG